MSRITPSVVNQLCNPPPLLLALSLQTLSAVSVCSLCLQSLSAVSLFSLCLQSLSSVSVCSLCLQSLSAVSVCSLCLQSLSAPIVLKLSRELLELFLHPCLSRKDIVAFPVFLVSAPSSSNFSADDLRLPVVIKRKNSLNVLLLFIGIRISIVNIQSCSPFNCKNSDNKTRSSRKKEGNNKVIKGKRPLKDFFYVQKTKVKRIFDKQTSIKERKIYVCMKKRVPVMFCSHFRQFITQNDEIAQLR